ncbi:hypothetical protein GGTG_11926 [Gaeumannomyces tritici R3-111a-1]|uniref:Uncharacterized protein n=1 Tax=Gaeumannomyces tritici (strain R3-111a-1) TaxID=644352 RepID=J3PEJ5_GAET3|nr:hypothetical protein GGTG_11926 [Gaeumannomyces tritici R3-111a-1]EJT70903.1 hypothetical protein GGTG_11926 [Gaeumannomyces tritici R3-111a-1]
MHVSSSDAVVSCVLLPSPGICADRAAATKGGKGCVPTSVSAAKGEGLSRGRSL